MNCPCGSRLQPRDLFCAIFFCHTDKLTASRKNTTIFLKGVPCRYTITFFLALSGICPYSAPRARLVLFEASRRACSTQF